MTRALHRSRERAVGLFQCNSGKQKTAPDDSGAVLAAGEEKAARPIERTAFVGSGRRIRRAEQICVELLYLQKQLNKQKMSIFPTCQCGVYVYSRFR